MSAAGTLGPIVTHAAPTSFVRSLDLATNGAGRTHLVWVGDDGVAKARVAPRGTAGGAFSDVLRVSLPSDIAYTADTALDRNGNARIIWHTSSGIVRTRIVTFEGTRRAPETVSPSAQGWGGASSPRVAVNASGEAAVVWLRSPDGLDYGRIQLSVGP
jgi:hypothetical protein